MKRAVFLDRDGTLNVDVGYLHRLEDLELFPWTTDALRLLKRAGYTLVVVTNQSGIAHGLDRSRLRRRSATTRCGGGCSAAAPISMRCTTATTIRAARCRS